MKNIKHVDSWLYDPVYIKFDIFIWGYKNFHKHFWLGFEFRALYMLDRYYNPVLHTNSVYMFLKAL